MAERIYYCTVCERQETVKDGDPIPFCCGRDMEPLPSCTLAPNPEMARNYNEDSPCDDGTQAGRRKKA
jgi:hypothetical protein